MMDNDLVLCEELAVGTSVGSVASTYAVYIPAMKDHKGDAMDDRPNVSGRLCLNIVTEGADLVAAVDGSVLTFDLYMDTDTTPTTGGTKVITYAITVNTAATDTNYSDGTLICSIPLPIMQMDQYLGLYMTIATQEIATGKVTAWIGTPHQQG